MKKEDKKAFERNVKKLEYILGHRDLNAILSKDKQEVFRCALEIMKGQLGSLTVKDPVPFQVKGKQKSTVKEALNTLLSAVINQPMRPILRDLGMEFGLLAFNWNKTFGKRPDIANVAVTIKNIVEKTLSLMEAIDIIKGLTNRVRDMERFSPPAFELSKHYLKSLGGD